MPSGGAVWELGIGQWAIGKSVQRLSFGRTKWWSLVRGGQGTQFGRLRSWPDELPIKGLPRSIFDHDSMFPVIKRRFRRHPLRVWLFGYLGLCERSASEVDCFTYPCWKVRQMSRPRDDRWSFVYSKICSLSLEHHFRVGVTCLVTNSDWNDTIRLVQVVAIICPNVLLGEREMHYCRALSFMQSTQNKDTYFWTHVDSNSVTHFLLRIVELNPPVCTTSIYV